MEKVTLVKKLLTLFLGNNEAIKFMAVIIAIFKDNSSKTMRVARLSGTGVPAIFVELFIE